MLTEKRIQTTQSNQLPAGGSNQTPLIGKRGIPYIVDLDRSKPNRFTLLGQDLVIWWDRQAACWRVFEDQCPHRLVPLSEGRIAEDGLLECPYHGHLEVMGCVIAFPNRLQGAPLTSPNVPVSTNGRAAGLALCLPRSTGKCS